MAGDERLVAALRAGDESAFAELVMKYQSTLLRLARMYVSTDAVAQEVVGDTWLGVMGERPTTALWGIGSKTAKKLAALGIDTVTQLAQSDARVLAAELGPTMGPWYHRIGRGVSDSVVTGEAWVPAALACQIAMRTSFTGLPVPSVTMPSTVIRSPAAFGPAMSVPSSFSKRLKPAAPGARPMWT